MWIVVKQRHQRCEEPAVGCKAVVEKPYAGEFSVSACGVGRSGYLSEAGISQWSSDYVGRKDLKLSSYLNQKKLVEASNITKKDLEKWKTDLRRLTKIYRDINPEEEKAAEKITECDILFKNFSKHFYNWIYYKVLQKTDSFIKYESEEEQAVRKKAWIAYTELGKNKGIFWDYNKNSDLPDPQKMARERNKNIQKYNADFNAVIKALEEYLEQQGGKLERREMIERTTVGPFNVLIRTKGATKNEQKILNSFLRVLTDVGKKIEKAGFPGAVKELTVVMNFNRDDMVRGQYDHSKDQLVIHPLGMMNIVGTNTFIHECGHRFYYRNLPPQARSHWDNVVDSRQLTIKEQDIQDFVKKYIKEKNAISLSIQSGVNLIKQTENDPEKESKYLYLMQHSPASKNPEEILQHHLNFNSGEKVNLEELTDYGATNPSEAFAEAFTAYILKGPKALNPWTRAFFTKICQAGGARISMANVLHFSRLGGKT